MRSFQRLALIALTLAMVSRANSYNNQIGNEKQPNHPKQPHQLGNRPIFLTKPPLLYQVKQKIPADSRQRYQQRNKPLPQPETPQIMSHIQTKYTIQHVGICTDNTEIIFWIHTAPDHVRKRLTLRLTWGNTKTNLIKANTAMVFFLGLIKPDGTSKKKQKMLEYESELYGDIIQEDYIDSYRNMSYKAISGARWVTNHCPQAKLVIKADDDALIDLPCLIHEVKNQQSVGRMRENTMLCK